MAYFDTDMDIEQEPSFDRVDTEYTIYVKSLPSELNKIAIEQVFNQYGKITGMFHPDNATWAYITYKSYREAERAIRELNDKKPLYLKVALSKKKSIVKEEELQKPCVLKAYTGSPRGINAVAEPSVSTCNDIKLQQSMGRGQVLNALRKHFVPQIMSDRYAENRSQASRFYEIEESTMNANKLWTRGVVTVTEDGRRHVSLGRGYTLYEFPEQNPKVEECILKVFEKRHNGLYEYGEDKFKDGVQKCLICSNKTTKHCEKCYTYYCSIVCQRNDWPRHQIECQRIPRLVEEPVNEMSLLQINEDENQTKTLLMSNQIITSKTIASNETKLRRPNTSHIMQAKNSNDQPELSTMNTKDISKQNQLLTCNNTENIEKSRKNDLLLSTSTFTDQNHSRSHQNSAITKSSQNKKKLDNNLKSTAHNDRESPDKQRNTSSRNSTCSSSMNDDLYQDTYLSKTEFTEIEILISLDNGEYWISKIKDSEMRTKLMTELQSVALKSRNVQPIIGNIYGVLYETLWHRAMITSLNPIKVHFIDYGNSEILEKGAEIRDISNMTVEYMKVPNLARKIRLTPAINEKYKNLQYGEKIFVKMLSIDAEKTIIVDIKETSRNLHMENTSNINNTNKKIVQQEDLKMNENTKASMVQIPSILDAFADLFIQKAVLKLEFEGFIQIHEYVQENIYKATLGPKNFATEVEMLLNLLQEECMKMQKPVNYKPREELICGEAKDTWYRGYISASSTSSDLRIIAIDEARILEVNKIVPCPKKFLNIYAIGVICEVNDPNKLEVGEVYEFSTIMNKQNYKQENLKITIIKDSKFVCEAIMKSWISMIKTPFPAFSEIKNGSKICFTSYRNHYQVFVRSLDEEAIEYYNTITQCVAQCARTAQYLSNSPNDMQAVIAPFSDNNSYRAMVIKTQNDKAQIIYTDFGNMDEVNIRDLQVLPENLALQRSCSAKITLKDVPFDVPMNLEVDFFLRKLVGNETPLTCVYDGDPLKNGVYLTMPTGESVNDKINQLLTPTWKQKNYDDNTCYMLNDVEFASLGDVGDTVNAVVLYVQKEGGGTRYMMGPFDIELYSHITEVMPKLLKEYCEKTEYYIPRKQELCLALYENEWYRAACLDPQKSYTTAEIFYIDYGNIETVEHKNIRLMPKDFIVPAALANMCTVVNLGPVDNEGNYSSIIQQKIAELIQENESIVKIKIVDSPENGDYKIELVDIKNTLIKENLIST